MVEGLPTPLPNEANLQHHIVPRLPNLQCGHQVLKDLKDGRPRHLLRLLRL